MKFSDLQKLVSQGETDTVEFKQTTGQLTAGVKTLCAFLNTKGGTILFGVSDNGTIKGQTIEDKTKRHIVNELNKITPKTLFNIDYVDIGKKNKFVISISAKHEPENAPYMFDGRAYLREQTSTFPMDQERYNYLLSRHLMIDKRWVQQSTHDYVLDDLDFNEITRCIAKGTKSERLPPEVKEQSVEKQLYNFRLLTKEQNLTNAAIVLFAKKLNSDFTHCEIQLAKFMGNDTSKGFIDEQKHVGNAFFLLEKSEEFIRKHLNIGIKFNETSFSREDRPSIPLLALREALVNAFCHRDYSIKTSIKFALFDDRLEIWSPGKLLPEVTLEELKFSLHTSLQRNELIAHVFYIRKLIEKWGTGTSRILTICKESGMYEPTFSLKGEGFLVTFKLGFRIDELSNRERLILAIIQNQGSSVREIKSKLDKTETVTTRTLNRDLKHLQELQFVESQGSGRSHIWLKK